MPGVLWVCHFIRVKKKKKKSKIVITLTNFLNVFEIIFVSSGTNLKSVHLLWGEGHPKERRECCPLQLQKKRNLPVFTDGPVAFVYGNEARVDGVKESENIKISHDLITAVRRIENGDKQRIVPEMSNDLITV